MTVEPSRLLVGRGSAVIAEPTQPTLFLSLYCIEKLKKKDKDRLWDKEKEVLKKKKVDETWANWLSGFLIYAGVILREHLTKRAVLSQYLDRSHSGHMVQRASAGPRSVVEQPVQPRLFHWEFNSQGVCNWKSCGFYHECSLYGGFHLVMSCSRGKACTFQWKQGGGGPGSQAEKGPQPPKAENNVWLDHYPNQDDMVYLWLGFQDGFWIPALGVRQAYMARNLKSVQGMEQVVRGQQRRLRKVGCWAASRPHPCPNLQGWGWCLSNKLTFGGGA